MKTGIFGGAFNPVHIGHIMLAKNYMNALGLERIILIPTKLPPHKSADDFASGEDRINMLALAVKDEKGFEISDIEFKRDGKSYTFDTLCELKKAYPDDEFYLITGSDQFLYFDKWYKAQEITSLATLCTASRNKEDFEKLTQFRNQYPYLKDALIYDFEVIELSSSEIRERIRNKESISGMVDEKVEQYIIEKGLYV